MKDEKLEEVANKRTRITFENLSEGKFLDKELERREVATSELVNKEYWNNEKFAKIFFQRMKKFHGQLKNTIF